MSAGHQTEIIYISRYRPVTLCQWQHLLFSDLEPDL